MIYSLQGTLLEKTPDEAVIQCGGVGYLVSIPSSALGVLPAVGGNCTLYTYMNVSENLIALYGFADKENRAMFMLLTSVSGVGPKAGLAILSVLSPSRITLAISAADFKAFTAASGVGPKLAQRIVLELKDKVGKLSVEGVSLSDISSAAATVSSSDTSQAIAALISLGYTQSEAAMAVAKIDSTLPVQEIIRIALQGIGKGR